MWEALVKEKPTGVPYRQGLAGSYNALGIQQKQKGQYAEALATYQKSLAIYEALASERPDDPEAVHGVSYPYNDIGEILNRLGRHEEALSISARGRKHHGSVSACSLLPTVPLQPRPGAP